MNNAFDGDEVREQFDLRLGTRNAVENQRVVARVDLSLFDQVADVLFEHANGQLVRYEEARRGIGLKLLAQRRFLVDGATNVAHCQMHEVGHLADDGALRALARPGAAAKQYRRVSI